MSETQNNVSAMIEASRKDLLDLGLRNPLLNYRPSRARGVEIVDELSAEVFRILVGERKSMRFKAAPDEGESTPVGPGMLAQPSDEAEIGKPAARHVDLQLQTNLDSAKLQSRLLKTEHDARTFVEEQGVNVLYIALGMLCWFESDSSQEPRRAPLLLVPVTIERSNAQERFRVAYTEDDIGENLSLSTKLRLEFGISMPDMPPQEDLEVNRYLREVEASIRSQPRWSVDRHAMALNFFSFGKFLMYKDLDEESWPEGAKPSTHLVIKNLLGGSSAGRTQQIPEEEYLDDHLEPGEANQVVDADSSQTLALLDVKSGSDLVIQGPPGTGKSQTITNVIAEAVGHGKTVLFVSEKMAALEVVKRRLDEVGLGDACLELHSRKTNKKRVLSELDRTLGLGRPRLVEAEDDLRTLTSMRDRLNDYCKAVNTVIGKSGYTPHQAIGELVRQGTSGASLPSLDYETMRQWTGSEFKVRQGLVEELQAQLKRVGVPSESPFYGTTRMVLLPTEQPRIATALSNAKESLMKLRGSAKELASTLQLAPPDTRSETDALCVAARRALQAPLLKEIRLSAEEWRTRKEDLRALLAAGIRLSEVREQYAEVLIPEAWDHDLLETWEYLATHGRSWLRFMSSDYRTARKRFAGLCIQPPPDGLDRQLAIVDAVLEAHRQREVLERHESLGVKLYGARWQAEATDWQALSQVTTWLFALHEDIEAGQLPEGLLGFLSGNPTTEGLEQSIVDVEASLEDHGPALETIVEELGFAAQDSRTPFAEQPFETQEVTLDDWYRRLDELQAMVRYNQLAETCQAQGLESVLQQAEAWPDAASKIVAAFRYTWFEGLVEQAFRDRPALAHFDRGGHEYVAERFQDLDRLVLEHNRTRLAYAHWQAVPNHEAEGQLGTLRREIQKKRRHLPIRQLMRRAGNAIQAIKPVFMMGPLSIATFLEPGTVDFDLVVFDEASQVRPVEAFGAIVRGKQVVVVGDSKQLPPTSFFDSLTNTEEVDEDNVTTDLESILSMFVAQGAPERMLRWHYRSRHESLIAVSNHEFYDNRLVTFPSPDRSREDLGLVYHHLPNTLYDRGGTRSNTGEAKAVAKAVMEHAKTRPELTLGVAAFSTAQMQAIQDQLEILRRKDSSCEPFFAAHPFEPFFVKNLENVQGDERDVIFISVGYGRAAQGYLTMSFGPLNLDGGERRLNVLITRARRSCHVFTNLTADDIDLGRSSARGVSALKAFLQYAQNGRLDVPEATGREPDSPFEESVLSALQNEGYRVDTQVGSAGFFVDLAVMDLEKPGRYLLGIECDGATYHSARSARDRDRLRQEVLEGLGWRIHRVWSTDWFRNPKEELKRAIAAIEEARFYIEPQKEEPGTGNGGTDFVRDEGLAPFAAPGIPEYEKASLRLTIDGELHQASPNSLAEIVAIIVGAESPIHVQEVSRRITEAACVKRTGARIRATIDAAVKSAVRKQKICRAGDFLWHPDMPEAPLRDRSGLPSASRKHELIAPEEIASAIERVVARSYGIERSKIPALVLRMLLGSKRTTEAAQHRVTKILDGMVAEGKLSQEGEHVLSK